MVNTLGNDNAVSSLANILLVLQLRTVEMARGLLRYYEP